MLTLNPAILELGRDTLIQHDYSDFFPVPPELQAVVNGWAELLPYLESIDLTKHKPFRPLFSYAPKSKVNLRPVALLHPIDAVLYFALVRNLRDGIEAERIPEVNQVVFSFRVANAEDDQLYASHPGHSEFQNEQIQRAQLRPTGFVATADIAEFYPRLYQHRVRNALGACTSANNEGYPAALERMLRRLSADRTSYGIPIGPAASRPLAEAALIDVDHALTSFDIEFIHYIDDFYLFAATREEAEWNLRKLGEILNANHGLSLQSAKTKIYTSADFLEHVSEHKDVEDKVDAAFDKLVDEHFYEMESLDELSAEEKEALDSLDLGKILEDALDEDEINYKKVAFILDKLSSLERPDLISIVLGNLARLYPVAHAVHAFFRDFDSLGVCRA